jgi:hypothetical protein
MKTAPPAIRGYRTKCGVSLGHYPAKGNSDAPGPTLLDGAISSVPASRDTLDVLIEDPHLLAMGLLRDEPHDLQGPIRTIRPTILEDGVPANPGAPARPIGADTRAVLGEAGYSDAEIDALVASGAAHVHLSHGVGEVGERQRGG